MPPYRTLCTALRSQRRHVAPHHLTANYHSSLLLGIPYKDDQDRNSLEPKSTENTQSGTNEDVAKTDAAFDASKTQPEEEKKAAGKENQVNPLAASGASPKFSVPLGDEGGLEMKGTTNNKQVGRASRGGSPEKKRKMSTA